MFDYDLLLARSLSNSNQPADLAIRVFGVELSKTEGKINAFLSAAGVVGGVGVCASGAGTMACAAGALGALALPQRSSVAMSIPALMPAAMQPRTTPSSSRRSS
jgi:hypothetical protein